MKRNVKVRRLYPVMWLKQPVRIGETVYLPGWVDIVAFPALALFCQKTKPRAKKP